MASLGIMPSYISVSGVLCREGSRCCQVCECAPSLQTCLLVLLVCKTKAQSVWFVSWCWLKDRCRDCRRGEHKRSRSSAAVLLPRLNSWDSVMKKCISFAHLPSLILPLVTKPSAFLTSSPGALMPWCCWHKQPPCKDLHYGRKTSSPVSTLSLQVQHLLFSCLKGATHKWTWNQHCQ